MDDRLIMDTLLTSAKGMCDLMMHGAVESATPDVHAAFTRAFNDTLCMQSEIYGKMALKGWYPQQSAPKSQIDAAAAQFAL